MKRKKIDTTIDQKIVTAMVVSTEFLSQIASLLKTDYIQAKHLKQIASWCVKYYNKYHEAPKNNIESIYHSWVAKKKAPEEVVDAVHDVLEYLSDQYESDSEINVPYLFDIAVDYIKTRQIEALKDEIEYNLTEGDKNAASNAILNFSAVSSKIDSGIDPLNDDNVWDMTYAESQKPLIKWKSKDANTFFGPALCRDSLIAILASEKRGKSWVCVEFVMQALMNRRKVALFEVGDMSQSQIMKRFGVRLSKRPTFKKDRGIIKIPVSIEKDFNGKAQVETKDINCEKTANAKSSKEAVKKFLRANGMGSNKEKQNNPYFMLSTTPNSSTNVTDIDSILNQWEKKRNFVPDVIIIDYPDILAPEPGTSGMTTRDQVNATWKALRRLSQERHCLVIVPTQANAAAYKKELLEADNFSEDKRKLAHVTGMLGLNQNKEEKKHGIMRYNWIALREADFQGDLCLYVATCYKLGRAFCCATL